MSSSCTLHACPSCQLLPNFPYAQRNRAVPTTNETMRGGKSRRFRSAVEDTSSSPLLPFDPVASNARDLVNQDAPSPPCHDSFLLRLRVAIRERDRSAAGGSSDSSREIAGRERKETRDGRDHEQGGRLLAGAEGQQGDLLGQRRP